MCFLVKIKLNYMKIEMMLPGQLDKSKEHPDNLIKI